MPVEHVTERGELVPDKSRMLWLAVCLLGVVLAAGATLARVVGGPPDRDRAMQASSASSTSPAPSASMPQDSTDDPTATDGTTPSTGPTAGDAAADDFTAPPGWPAVDLPDAPPTEVVQSFLDAVLAADCASADRHLAAEFKERHGNCRTSGLVPKDVDNYDAEVDVAEPDRTRPTVTVPATLTYAGQDFGYRFELVIAKDAWQIRDVTQ